jgi:hypothetical protein
MLYGRIMFRKVLDLRATGRNQCASLLSKVGETQNHVALGLSLERYISASAVSFFRQS